MKLIPTPVQVYSNRIAEISQRLRRKKPKTIFWTIEEIKIILDLYNKGISNKTIASTVGRSENATVNKLYRVLHDQELVDYVVKATTVTKPITKVKPKRK